MGFIVTLLVLGFASIITELLVPGFGIFGIIGVVLLVICISSISNTYGIMIAVCSCILILFIMFIIYKILQKLGFGKKLVLKESFSSQSFDESEIKVSVGDKGKTATLLKPFGKASFNDETFEVTSEGDFIDKDVYVIVVRVSGKIITVKEELK